MFNARRHPLRLAACLAPVVKVSSQAPALPSSPELFKLSCHSADRFCHGCPEGTGGHC